jgi:hypothetical protein
MNKPNFFKRNAPKTDQVTITPANDKDLSFGKVFLPILIFVFVVFVLGYVGFKSFGAYQYTKANWPELWFAWNKPAMVKSVRVQYEHKQAALDQEFLNGKTSDQAFKEQVKETVKEELEAQAASPTPKTYSAFR